jgi:hypothetical protein
MACMADMADQPTTYLSLCLSLSVTVAAGFRLDDLDPRTFILQSWNGLGLEEKMEVIPAGLQLADSVSRLSLGYCFLE